LAQGLKLALSNNQPTTKLEKDLRHEAEVRIASIIAPVDKKAIPMAFLQMARWQKTAILVDAYSARLYMYENSKGRPKYIFDNYISIGKNGMIKKREGDHKTPIGVYHLEQFIPKQKLASIYGFGAMTLNFPNDWDRFNKIGGTNIWLHGVPYDTYSRAPLSSRGCVALSNRDVEELFKFSQINNTPVAINTKHQWLDFNGWEKQQETARKIFKQWLVNYNAAQQQKKPQNFSALYVDPDDVAIYSYPNIQDIQKMHSAESFLEFNGDNLEKMLKEQYQDNDKRAQQMLIEKMTEENNEQQNITDGMSSLLMFEFFVNGKRVWQYWQKSSNNWRLIYTNL
jgi:murein L,D-transpeptidase YafK